MATLLGDPPQRRHWKEFQLLMIVICQALGQELDISQGVLSTTLKTVLQICWGLSFLLPHRTSVMFETTVCPVKLGCGCQKDAYVLDHTWNNRYQELLI